MRFLSFFVFLSSLVLLLFLCSPGIAAETYDSLSDLTWLTEEYPPFNYIENGTTTGLMVDVVTAVSQQMGDEISRDSIRFLPWSEAYQTALKEPGTVLFSIARTPERENLFSWVGPVVSSDIALYSTRTRNISINSLEELTDYSIGTVADDVTIEYLVDAGVDRDAIVTGPDPYTLLRYLDDGTIDLFAYGDIAAEYCIKNATGKSGFYKVVTRIGEFPVYIGFSRGTPDELIEKFRSAFEELKKSSDNGEMSKYDQILSSWLLDEGLMHLQYLTEGYYPYTFKENGIPTGISVDILQYIFSQYNVTVPVDHFIFNTWEEVYQQTLNENGTVLCIMARSPEREDFFQWAGPIDKTSNVIFCLRESADTYKNMTPSEMKVGTIIDDIAATALINSGCTDIVYSTDSRELIQMLQEGSIDGWAYASMPGLQLINQHVTDPESIVPVHTLKTYDYYFAFNRNTSVPLVHSFQDMLDTIRTEKDQTGVSIYEKILYRYVKPVYSESTITAEEVMDLVNRTATDIAREAPGTIKRINAGQQPYQSVEKPDLYVFVYDSEVNMVAHADNIRMVGLNYHNKTDVAGTPFRDNIVNGAITNGSGWEDYIYINPVESGLFWKTTRYQQVSGSDGKIYIVCSGMFRNNPE